MAKVQPGFLGGEGGVSNMHRVPAIAAFAFACAAAPMAAQAAQQLYISDPGTIVVPETSGRFAVPISFTNTGVSDQGVANIETISLGSVQLTLIGYADYQNDVLVNDSGNLLNFLPLDTLVSPIGVGAANAYPITLHFLPLDGDPGDAVDPDSLAIPGQWDVQLFASWDGANGDHGFDVRTFRVTVVDDVPEPAAWTTMLLGIGALGAPLRRRRKALARI